LRAGDVKFPLSRGPPLDFATTLVYADCEPSEHEVEWTEQAFAAPTIDGAGERAASRRRLG
jgi:hypothetical protein